MMSQRCTHTEGAKHNCAYVAARNALIPEAESMTDRMLGEEPRGLSERKAYRALWTRTFFAEMDSLARRRGLIN